MAPLRSTFVAFVPSFEIPIILNLEFAYCSCSYFLLYNGADYGVTVVCILFCTTKFRRSCLAVLRCDTIVTPETHDRLPLTSFFSVRTFPLREKQYANDCEHIWDAVNLKLSKLHKQQ